MPFVFAQEAQTGQIGADYHKLLFGSASHSKIEESTTQNESELRFQAAAQKLQTGYKLSADEYRALGVGCAGYECHRPYFQNIAVVTAVYRDSPAARAGIKIGDKMIDTIKDNDQAKANPGVKQIQFRLAQAGDPVEVTILRDGNPVKITLMRMNIADIKEPKYRRMWERTVRNLGYPKAGVYTGTSIYDLSPNTK